MSSHRKDIRRIMNAINVIDGVYDRWSKKQGVKENTLILLYALDDGKPHWQKQLSEDWLIPKTTLNTIIKECVNAGYIVLKNFSEHKREKQICLTPKGKEYAKQTLRSIYEAEEEAMEKTLSVYSLEFIEGLEYFCENLKKTLEDNPERN